MGDQPATLRDSVSARAAGRESGAPVPGLLLLFSQGRPSCLSLPLRENQIELGRGDGVSSGIADPKMSRRHATVSYDGERFHITDLGSQNGTFLDGARVTQPLSTATARILRTGDSLFLLCGDLSRYRAGVEQRGLIFIGPALREVFEQASRAAQFGRTLHVTGESGSGKEGLARSFHAASRSSSGPFVAVNCATIPSGVAERILFGARKGAFSGATADTEGLIQSADCGTLFLDEIAELDLAVQAKLLRVIETREVMQVGGLRPRMVDILLCSASHRDLRSEVTQGRFREDLFFRINSPEVVVPPLRQRPEEIPWLIDSALRTFSAPMVAHSSFVESCLLRAWAGNIRELLAEVRAAAQNAVGRGTQRLEAQHLSERAGQPLDRPPEPRAGCALIFPPPGHPALPGHPPLPKLTRGLPEPAQIVAALEQSAGNISAAARALGLHRTQLTRLMEKHRIRTPRGDQSLDEDEEG